MKFCGQISFTEAAQYRYCSVGVQAKAQSGSPCPLARRPKNAIQNYPNGVHAVGKKLFRGLRRRFGKRCRSKCPKAHLKALAEFYAPFCRPQNSELHSSFVFRFSYHLAIVAPRSAIRRGMNFSESKDSEHALPINAGFHYHCFHWFSFVIFSAALQLRATSQDFTVYGDVQSANPQSQPYRGKSENGGSILERSCRDSHSAPQKKMET